MHIQLCVAHIAYGEHHCTAGSVFFCAFFNLNPGTKLATTCMKSGDSRMQCSYVMPTQQLFPEPHPLTLKSKNNNVVAEGTWSNNKSLL